MRLVNSQIELTPGEVTALEEAHEIVSKRAEKEHGEYNDEMLEWRLLGRLNAGQSTEELLEWARTAPFQQRKK